MTSGDDKRFGKSANNHLGDGGARPEVNGLIYARVSKQENDTRHSLDTQVETMEDVAEERNIYLPYDPVRDNGESGGDFNRSEFEKVLDHATNGDISTLLVTELSRLGRDAPATLYLVHRLQTVCGVTIETQSGSLDLEDEMELMGIGAKTIVDHVSVNVQARNSANTRNRRFREGNWSSGFPKIPLGYNETEDGWIEKNEAEARIVNEIFEHYRRSKCYSDTTEHIAEMYSEESDGGGWFGPTSAITKFDDPDELDTSKIPGKDDWQQVKRILNRDVYVGEPSMNHDSPLIEDGASAVDDPELAIVDEELHAQVQETIEQNKQKNSGRDAMDIDDFIAEFSMLSVFGSDPDLKLHCSECDTVMRKNGTVDLTGKTRIHNFECKNDDCGKQKRFPNLRAYNEIERLADLLSDDDADDGDS